MTRDRLDTAALVLGVAAVATVLIGFLDIRSDTIVNAAGPVPYSSPAMLTTPVVIILIVFGVLAVVGGLLGRSMGRRLAVLAGFGLGATAVLLLAQNIAGSGWLEGSRPSMALLGGLAAGLLAVGLTPRQGRRQQ